MEKRWIWPFELEEQIGAGGMGVVYRARFVKNDRRVALKLLPADRALNSTTLARFERELEILKDLRHPHIVHCFGGTCEGSQRFYAMELVDGGTLETLLKQRGRLSWEQTVAYSLELCSALEYAHAQGVVHRDIKPGNLLLTRGGQVKLSDFGLALMSAGDRLTSEGKTMGTLLYMAPEQIRGHYPVSNKTDLYALGCVMFEMLTGNTPFKGEMVGEILHQHIHTPAPRLGAVGLGSPPELEAIVQDLLKKEPGDRPADARAVARRLQTLQLGAVVRDVSPDLNLGNAPTKSVVLNQPTERVLQPVSAAPSGAAPSLSREVHTAAPASVIAGMALLLVAGLVWALAFRSPPRPYAKAEGLWVAALKHQQPAVRETAARALGELGAAAQGAVPQLTDALRDSESTVRSEAATALGKMGPAARSSRSVLLSVEKGDAVPEVRNGAAVALEQIQGRRTRSMLGVASVAVFSIVLAAAGIWILITKPFADFGELLSWLPGSNIERITAARFKA